MCLVTKYVSLILFFSGLVFISFDKNLYDYFLPAEVQLSKKMNRDLENLEKTGHLHKNFRQASELKIIFGSEKTEKFFQRVELPLMLEKINQKKAEDTRLTSQEFLLEVFVDLLEEGGVILQYDLVDKKSGNTIWELSRTYKLSNI